MLELFSRYRLVVVDEPGDYAVNQNAPRSFADGIVCLKIIHNKMTGRKSLKNFIDILKIKMLE